MLKKIFKWILVTLSSIVALVLLFYVFVYIKTQARINKVYDVKIQSLVIPADSASYLSGKHIAENRGCMGCHGNNLAGGRAFLDTSSPVGVLYAANITSGKGGINFTDADWIKALRHGLGKDNKPLWFMPSHEIYLLSNQEMASLIGYVKHQPAVDNTVPAHSLKPLGRLLTFFGKFPLLPAEMIDHNVTYKEHVEPAVTAEYGGYLATSCKGCHGLNFKGGPPNSPVEPPIPDISSTGHPGKWKDTDLLTVFHSGKTPEGKQLSIYMPWKDFTYTDDEIKAIFLYLHQVP